MAEGFSFPDSSLEAPMSLKRLVESFERRLILDALERAGGNQRRAAADLGLLPTTLNEKMRRHGLRACDRPFPSGALDAGRPSELTADGGLLRG